MRRAPVIVAACAAAACALAAPAPATTVKELGDKPDVTVGMPAADCPSSCQAIAQVTGFQVQIGTASTPFRLRQAGYVVGFTVRLSKPNSAQVAFFDPTYGTPAKVRLAIIHSVSQSKKTYKLLKQSQAFAMDRYFGSTQTYALHTPLRVQTNDIVALTVPTWLPAFAHSLPSDNAWRSSHTGSDCTASMPPNGAHEKVGTTKTYGCFYRGARLLYSATFIPDPKVTSTASSR